MHTFVSYIAKKKDGTVINEMLTTCFSKIISDLDIVEVIYYPTNIPYALLCGKSGNPYHKVNILIPQWIGYLNTLFGGTSFECVKSTSGSVCGIKYTRPVECSLALYKLHLFCMREPFNNPQVGVFMWRLLYPTVAEGGTNTRSEIWDALVFLGTFNFHNVYGDFVRDQTHSLFFQDGAACAAAFYSLDRVLERAKKGTSLVNSICKGGELLFSSRLKTVAIVGQESGSIGKQLIPAFKEFRTMMENDNKA